MKYYSFLFFLLSLIFFQNVYTIHKSAILSSVPIHPYTSEPEQRKIYSIAIIGAGAAGTMAAKRAVLNNNEILLFKGAKQEQKRSRGNWVRKVDNIPGLVQYKRAIVDLLHETLEELKQGPFANNLSIIEDSVYFIEREANFFKLTDGSGHTYQTKYVVLATGIMDEQPHIQGSIRPVFKYANGQTIAYCSICDGHRSFRKKTVVIGHSDSAARTALGLSEKYPVVSMSILTNGLTPNFHPKLLKHLQDKNIRIFESPILEVLGNKKAKQLSGFKLETQEIVEADICFVSLGIRPNNQLALQLGAQVDANGLVITDPYGESTVPNLFIIGDLRSNSMKQIYTAWQHAVESIQMINQRIRDQKEALLP